MKKLSILLSALLASCVLFTSCATNNNSSASNPASTSNPEPAKKEIIMATEAGFAPYEYFEGDKVVGVDVLIAEEIAKAMGGTLKVVDMEFGAIIPAVSSGKATFGAAGMSITEERLKEIDFTIEYAVSEQVIVSKADSNIKAEADLSGKNVGVQLGTVADLYISDEMADVKVAQYNKYSDAANDLKNGKLDAIVMDLLPAQEMVAAHGELKIQESLFTDKYAIAVKKGDTETLNAINAVLEQLIKDGKIEEFTLQHTAQK